MPDTGSGYANCTGTSMSSPYAASIGAIVRGVNPLLTKNDIKDILTSTASPLSTPPDIWDEYHGYGIPDAARAVTTALGKVVGRIPETLQNRLTPLFSMYSSAAEDHFYTTVPQMTLAAFYGTLQPQPPSPDGPVYYAYTSTGPVTPGYSGIPCYSGWCPPAPRASVYIFTTENSPIAGTPSLVPLYRLSYQGAFGTNPSNVDHTYAVDASEVKAFVDEGYQLDGIEGYVYETCEPDCVPPGAVRLSRRYNPTKDDFGLFRDNLPEEVGVSERDYMRENEGYTHIFNNKEWIGYVYPNVDTDGDHLIDGFERIIGTCVGNPYTNGSQILDGDAVMTYSGGPTGSHSYGDPGLCRYITSSPSPYDFGKVVIDAPTVSYTFTLFHGGSVLQEPDLEIYSIDSSNEVDFTVVNDACSNHTLTPGGNCMFKVEFNPVSVGEKNTTLTVLTNDPSEPEMTISVSGEGIDPPQYSLTVMKAGTGSGTIADYPQSLINCGTDCSETLYADTQVSLVATPDTNSIFSGWSGDCSGSVCTLMMNSNKNVTASFTRTFDIAILPGGGGTISPSSATVTYGANAVFTITPDPGATLIDVRVDGASMGAISSYTFNNVTASHTIAAVFACQNLPARNPRTAADFGSLQEAFDAAADGDIIQVRAETLIGSSSFNRSGIAVTVEGGYDCNYTANSNSGRTTFIKGQVMTALGVTTLKNIATLVQFADGTSSLTVSLSDSTVGRATGSLSGIEAADIKCGSGFSDCSEVYVNGVTVTLTATPVTGYHFTGWVVNGSTAVCSGTTSCILTMDSAKSVMASFSRTYTMAVGVYANGYWYLDKDGNDVWDGTPTDLMYNFGGMSGAQAVTGDWDGSGTTKIGVYTADGLWYLDKNGNGAWDGTPTDLLYNFGGMSGAQAVAGDWDGSGTTKIGVYTTDGLWYLDKNGNGTWDGTPTDLLYNFLNVAGASPVTGDWNGSGSTKIGIFSDDIWYLDFPGTGTWIGCGAPADPAKDKCIDGTFGSTGHSPVSGQWQ